MNERSDEYKVFEARLKVLLPEEYRESYEDVQPVSMGSAGLKYGSDGRVAWDEIWGSFCDLAMAGGPPHKGTLLEPATKAEIGPDAARYRQVVQELCRGVGMVTGLAAEPSLISGWIHVDCPSATMAGWLARAINMENVSAHCQGMVLHLPAGPAYRVEKEIKNVITSIAKTAHYWLQHTSAEQHRAVAELFEIMEEESPLIQAPFSPHDTRGAAFEALRGRVAEEIHAATGLPATGCDYHGWLGVNCGEVRSAIRLMRAMVVSNVLCRREGTSIYLPVDPSADPSGSRLVGLFGRAYRLAGERS
ncbi:MAG: hypothetical protein PW789_07940 [Edaphobacter sp.]|uniref:hypothetical protein n=1 Tax=Edaphobacter sp. TaxID=1934404 RepID=UPI002392BFE1|nr:hypothetical protein [Edaphobacter sp.]MDE1176524.1 hypothetical protein [Edaphobacter sp.]